MGALKQIGPASFRTDLYLVRLSRVRSRDLPRQKPPESLKIPAKPPFIYKSVILSSSSHRRMTAPTGAMGGFAMATEIKRPDEAAMRRLLDRYPFGPEGAILRLAWLQGLSRAEITALTWDQVDPERGSLSVSGREIPLAPSTAQCLALRRRMYGDLSDHVVLADRGKRPMTPQSVSRLARLALDSEGQDADLMDLRHDWVLRQLEVHDWAYVARISGMAVVTLRGRFGPCLQKKPADSPSPLTRQDEAEYTLWRVVQQEGSSTAGLAIWMCWKLQMQPGEAAALTWRQVDFEQNLLRLPDRALPMGTRLRRLLLEAWERQKGLPTDKVFVAPTTGRPIDLSRITSVTRTALIRGGMESVTLRDLSAWSNRQEDDRRLLDLAAQRGFLTRSDVMDLLNVSDSTAWRCLSRLQGRGLTRVGAKYYPQGTVVSPEEQSAAIRDYLRRRGIASRQEFVELLRVTPHQATYILKNMVDRGELERVGKRYRLPPEALERAETF